jgi:hypothetical protein
MTEEVFTQSTRIVSFIPDWVLFVSVGIALFIVYNYILPDDSKAGVKRVLRTYAGYLFFIVLWIIFRNKWGIVADNEFWGQMRVVTLLCIFGVLGFFAFSNWLFEWRYYSRHLVANNLQGACHRFEKRGHWIIFFLDGAGEGPTEKMIFPWPFPKRLLVAHESTVEYKGGQIVVNAQVKKVSLGSINLPPKINQFIEGDTFARWAKDNVYFGLVSEELRVSNPSWDKIEEELNTVSAKYNKLQQQFDDVTGESERYGGHIRRMKSIFGPRQQDKRQYSGGDEQYD